MFKTKNNKRMKKTASIILAIFVTVTIGTHAQEVISTNGNYDVFPGGSITWSMGQPFIETISNGSNELTLGFVQTDLFSEHIFTLPQGWSYISSFLSPVDSDIANVISLLDVSVIFVIDSETLERIKITSAASIDASPLLIGASLASSSA